MKSKRRVHVIGEFDLHHPLWLWENTRFLWTNACNVFKEIMLILNKDSHSVQFSPFAGGRFNRKEKDRLKKSLQCVHDHVGAQHLSSVRCPRGPFSFPTAAARYPPHPLLLANTDRPSMPGLSPNPDSTIHRLPPWESYLRFTSVVWG